ncbi:hypothetical protein DFH27DRAFT_643780 [Peziza echinospora]|nr:hypothetical protein DFH27DRAFT_643780 [Peziza echinospora]
MNKYWAAFEVIMLSIFLFFGLAHHVGPIIAKTIKSFVPGLQSGPKPTSASPTSTSTSETTTTSDLASPSPQSTPTTIPYSKSITVQIAQPIFVLIGILTLSSFVSILFNIFKIGWILSKQLHPDAVYDQRLVGVNWRLIGCGISALRVAVFLQVLVSFLENMSWFGALEGYEVEGWKHFKVGNGDKKKEEEEEKVSILKKEIPEEVGDGDKDVPSSPTTIAGGRKIFFPDI